MKPFYRWHPQIALRYLPIVKYIKQLNLKSGPDGPKILEVGSGSLGIGPYLHLPFTGVDIDFKGPKWPQMKQVSAQATKLPFPDKSFDIVISVDVLEHLPLKQRQPALTEAFRVAKQAVILAFPTGKLSHQQDIQLDKLYKQKFNKPFPFLTEHLQYPLPQQQAIIKHIKVTCPNCTICTQGNRNLDLRAWLMKGWITNNKLVDIFFRKVLLVFLPFLKILDKYPPHYRQIIFVNINNLIINNPAKHSARKTAE